MDNSDTSIEKKKGELKVSRVESIESLLEEKYADLVVQCTDFNVERFPNGKNEIKNATPHTKDIADMITDYEASTTKRSGIGEEKDNPVVFGNARRKAKEQRELRLKETSNNNSPNVQDDEKDER